MPLILPHNQILTYWIKIEHGLFFENFKFELIPFKSLEPAISAVEYKETKLFGFILMIFGLFFFTGLISTFQSIYFKDKNYVFWAIYLLSNALFFLAELNRGFYLTILPALEDPKLTWAVPWPSAIQYLVSISYLLFLNSFLEIWKQNPMIFKVIKLSIFFMISCFVFSVYVIFPYKSQFMIYADILLVPSNVLILIVIVLIIRSSISQKNLLMVGSIGVLITATISVLLEIFSFGNQYGFWFIPIVCYGLGAVWEFGLFSMALSQRTKRIQLNAIQLQKNYTLQLENELNKRLEIIHIKDKLLEEQRINTITTEFEQKIAETEISALRSQMNPHFIFNCLNSIKLYSLENDSKAASEYLTKFSRLIRMVLENSRSEKVTLENELETLTLYIEMEAMRFKNKVKYQILVAKEIDTQFIEIPPLLIQPFVENAIWHGLMQKNEGGTVKVEVSQKNDSMIEITIEDDGIGREKALEFKSKSAMHQKSFGMKVTTERIDLINQMYNTNTKVEIVDLKDKTGNALGTKVILQIPF